MTVMMLSIFTTLKIKKRMKEKIIINHDKKKVSEAIGIDETSFKFVVDLRERHRAGDDYPVSMALVDMLKIIKAEDFNIDDYSSIKDESITSYELKLLYGGMVFGSAFAERRKGSGLLDSLPPHLKDKLGDIMKGISDKVGDGKLPSSGAIFMDSDGEIIDSSELGGDDANELLNDDDHESF